MTRASPSPVLLASIVLSTLGLGAPARADAIMGPPDDCAPGSIAMSSHWGAWCEDTTCTTDADCAGVGNPYGLPAPPRVCRTTSVCVPTGTTRATGARTLDSPRGSYPGPGRPVTGACSTSTACSEGVCDEALRCVLGDAQPDPPSPPPPPPPPPPPETSTTTDTASAPRSASCGVAHHGTARLPLVGLTLLTLTLSRRPKRTR
ncbi:MAG: hypothetical protein J0L92_35185 [Deltaproteobacteria bacterium]|nr:hypothetical protein [Deltaproteobacteria bacterium]